MEEEYKKYIKTLMEVYQIFIDHFGEDRVDLQNAITFEDFANSSCSNISPYILVHFPEVRISNEYDKYVDVKDLWAKVIVKYNGTGGDFYIGRSHYLRSHITSDYAHSHIPGVPHFWGSPCLGHGPIRSTIGTLLIEYDDNIWRLYCRELEVYMRTESISGGPYRRLEDIHVLGTSYIAPTPHRGVDNVIPYVPPKDFIKYIIDSKKLKFSYQINGFALAMPPVECQIILSNLFIEWYNNAFNNDEVEYSKEELFDRGVISEYIIKNGKIYTLRNYNNNRITSGEQMGTFKGQPIIITIENDYSDKDNNLVILLNSAVIAFIIVALITVLNCKYGKSEQTETSTNKRTRYYL